MAPSGGNRIVRTYWVPDAPTGEGTRYVTEDGAHWKDVVGPRRTAHESTGEAFGQRIGNTITRKP